jgi:RNA polymerase sigma-70 factor (ECF subfamily)
MITTQKSMVCRLQNGRDWEQFVRIYEPLLRKLISRAGVPLHEVPDILQDLFVRILKNISQFQSHRGRFRAWLRAIVKNRIHDWYRLQCRQASPAESLSWCLSAEEDFDRLHREEILRVGMQAIRESSQPLTWYCFQRHVLEQQPASAVAEELGLSTNAVYLNSSRTLGRIREWCLEYGEELE